MPAAVPEVHLSAPEIAANPVWQLLSAAGIDWTAGRAKLVARHGLTHDRISQDRLVFLPTDFPAFNNLIEPLSFRPNINDHPALPLSYISGSFSNFAEVAANVMHMRHELEPFLGQPQESAASNTIGWRWQQGRASVTLTGWPRALNRHFGQNDYHKREPRLIDACSIVIEPGYCRPLLPAEAALLVDMQPLVAHITPAQGNFLFDNTRAEYLRQWRTAYPLLSTHVAITADRSHIVCGAPELFALLPLADIARLDVMRIQPARFSGYSTLFAVMTTGLADCPEKSVALSSRDGPDDFNEDAPALAASLGLPCVLQNYGTED